MHLKYEYKKNIKHRGMTNIKKASNILVAYEYGELYY